MSNWTQFLKGIDHPITLAGPATSADLASASDALGHDLPEDLVALLLETDGVLGEYSLALVWPIERIVRDNLMFRSNTDFATLYMSFDPLLFFSDAGNGDQFAFAVLRGEIPRADIFVWNHEDDSRQWVAPSLRIFLQDWCTGKLTI